MAEIIAADDSATIRHIIKKYLEDKHKVRTATNGREVLEKFKESPPDLFVLDLQMPVLDGFAVCEAIKKDTNLPVIILTSMDEKTDKDWAKSMGADKYLTKPVDEDELLTAVEELLN